jgi:hypothetical protein
MMQVAEIAQALLQEAVKLAKAIDTVRRQKAIRKATGAIARLFRKQGVLFLERLPKYADRFLQAATTTEAFREALDDDLASEFSDIFGLTKRQAEDAMAMVLMDGMTGGYLEQATSFGIDLAFKLPNERAVAWAKENAAKRVAQINATTEDEIRGLITRGLEEGKSYGEVAREIKGRFSEFAEGRPQEHIKSRAELVAVNENAEAMEEGGLSLARDVEAAGIEMEKQWYVSEGQTPCDLCIENGKVDWIPLDEAYPSGHEHPPGHPACLCLGLHRMKE